MMTFDQALRLAGFRPRDVVADGQWRRCATDDKPGRLNGAYVLYPWGVGYYRNRATDGNENHKWEDGTKTDHTPSAAHLEALQRKRDAERAARVQAMRSANDYWKRCHRPNRLHPYLAAKGLSPVGTQGLRECDGWLVVPVYQDRWMVSVQNIHPDGTKRFWTGAPIKAGAFILDRPHAAVTVLCEGLATGMAVFQAVKHARVVVCFDAGNLLPVTQRLKPTGSVVYAADNDAGTLARRGFNPGIEKAHNAAELIGAGVAFPQGIEGTDWADALREWGQQGAKRIERQILAGARYVATPS